MKLFIILGNQLFNPKYLSDYKDHTFFMAEDYGLCTFEKHHKLKILLFLSSMRSFKDELKTKNFNLIYKDVNKDFKLSYEKKLEKKDKIDKARKLYAQAFNKLEKAYKSDKKNPDILNYMGFTTRKTGNFEKAEKFYLEGLSLKPDHNGINEYLGELYVQTNRIDKANERLEVLKSCNCKEYSELELIIKTRGSKVY